MVSVFAVVLGVLDKTVSAFLQFHYSKFNVRKLYFLQISLQNFKYSELHHYNKIYLQNRQKRGPS